MKFARIINDVAVDVVTDPTTSFHPDLAALFVLVPDDVVAGSRLDGDNWTPPAEAPGTVQPSEPHRMSLIDFLRLFTPTEMAGFNALRKTVAALAPEDYGDPTKAALVGFEVGLMHYDALREGLIELDHIETVQWLSLLVPLGVLTAERLPLVLAGQAPA